jgi:hypothetical protein
MNGQVVVATRVGGATGSRAAAAALACAGTERDRPGLLIDVGGGRRPRPSLIAAAAARELEERLAAHLPQAHVAARGVTCHLALPGDQSGLDSAASALPLVREAIAIVHLPPGLLQPALAHRPLHPTAALLRADLASDRALAALAVHGLIESGLRVAVLKWPLGRLAARRALAGLAAPGGGAGLPPRLCRRLLGPYFAASGLPNTADELTGSSPYVGLDEGV